MCGNDRRNQIDRRRLFTILYCGLFITVPGCVVTPSTETREFSALRAHTETIIRHAQTDLAAVRQQLATVTVMAAKKEGELQELRDLFAQVRQDNMEASNTILSLRQSLNAKETDLTQLRELHTRIEVAKDTPREKDQELAALKDTLGTVTDELDRLRRAVNHLSTRPSVTSGIVSSLKPTTVVPTSLASPEPTPISSSLFSFSGKIMPAIQTDREESSRGRRRITVQPGDSLWKLARRYHMPLSALRQANGTAGDALVVGQELVIPVYSPAVP